MKAVLLKSLYSCRRRLTISNPKSNKNKILINRGDHKICWPHLRANEVLVIVMLDNKHKPVQGTPEISWAKGYGED